MDASIMFLDCPAYMDATGSVRCGLPAEVADQYTMSSTDGPLENVRLRCPRGHWFNGPVDAMLAEKSPGRPPRAAGPKARGRLAPGPRG